MKSQHTASGVTINPRLRNPLQAVDSWFIRVEHLREALWANTEQTYWVPEKVKEGRFRNWLENTRDWAVSRTRFWGTPIPIWASDDGEEMHVVSSVEELQRLSGAHEQVRCADEGPIQGCRCPCPPRKRVWLSLLYQPA